MPSFLLYYIICDTIKWITDFKVAQNGRMKGVFKSVSISFYLFVHMWNCEQILKQIALTCTTQKINYIASIYTMREDRLEPGNYHTHSLKDLNTIPLGRALRWRVFSWAMQTKYAIPTKELKAHIHIMRKSHWKSFCKLLPFNNNTNSRPQIFLAHRARNPCWSTSQAYQENYH